MTHHNGAGISHRAPRSPRALRVVALLVLVAIVGLALAHVTSRADGFPCGADTFAHGVAVTDGVGPCAGDVR